MVKLDTEVKERGDHGGENGDRKGRKLRYPDIRIEYPQSVGKNHIPVPHHTGPET